MHTQITLRYLQFVKTWRQWKQFNNLFNTSCLDGFYPNDWRGHWPDRQRYPVFQEGISWKWNHQCGNISSGSRAIIFFNENSFKITVGKTTEISTRDVAHQMVAYAYQLEHGFLFDCTHKDDYFPQEAPSISARFEIHGA